MEIVAEVQDMAEDDNPRAVLSNPLEFRGRQSEDKSRQGATKEDKRRREGHSGEGTNRRETSSYPMNTAVVRTFPFHDESMSGVFHLTLSRKGRNLGSVIWQPSSRLILQGL